jgi:hypothetical protein
MKSAFVSISLAAALLAGCGSRAASPMSAVPPVASADQVTTVAFDDAGFLTSTPHISVGIRLEGENPFTSPAYGKVLGYFKGLTSTTSEVISVQSGKVIKFRNVDPALEHTMSFLGDATSKSAPWPKTFTGSGTKSKAGTDIGTKDWSTGPLAPGTASLLYNTGAPGFYMVGCFFHYVSAGMRTVIIVQ